MPSCEAPLVRAVVFEISHPFPDPTPQRVIGALLRLSRHMFRPETSLERTAARAQLSSPLKHQYCPSSGGQAMSDVGSISEPDSHVSKTFVRARSRGPVDSGASFCNAQSLGSSGVSRLKRRSQR
jgi:hypothetical protein